MNGKMQAGFTLMEMIVAMAILAVLAAVAIPDIKMFLDRQRIRDAVNELSATYRDARWEAMRSTKDATLNFTQSSGGLAWNLQVSNASGTLKTLDSSRFACVVSCTGGNKSLTLSANRGLPTSTGSTAISLTSRVCTQGQQQALFDQACNQNSASAMAQLCALNPGSITITVWPTGQSSVDKSQCPGA